MDKLIVFTLFTFTLIVFTVSLDCPSKCDPSKCPEPIDCFAGVIKDQCNCCSVCGQFEGNRCFDAKLQGLNKSYQLYGACGENLECRLRKDLDPSEPAEALCFCIKPEMVCGSDGETYDNICQLNEARYKRRDGLVASSNGPCQSAPKIVSKPENYNVSLGENVAFMCQAVGWPVPVIQWKVMLRKTHEIKRFNSLTNNDTHITIQTRDGLKPFEMTSWLQVVGIKANDDGEYHCIASNEMGETFDYGVLIVNEKVDQHK
ncbi:insulin-like growth factor-binding protein-related protein 1 [Tetranychus urticae]|uniref:Uncharacterized protein n=1 Tax=Tetranychus urticae TaxID=32264 RepID=T1L2W0_TETUR|nr:insulin-like growth factor-binding protein-related protein 1 [Tetranychus urticae]XP_015794753.1 insulin-like growth factor-binding protein-related protein 1 [Tetranychus urticae]